MNRNSPKRIQNAPECFSDPGPAPEEYPTITRSASGYKKISSHFFLWTELMFKEKEKTISFIHSFIAFLK